MSVDATWREFRHDPRRAANAAVRTSDADRELARGLLEEAYAEGRLDVRGLESRTDALTPDLTLGGLLDLLSDLVPMADPEPTPAPSVASGIDAQVARAMAVAGFRGQLLTDLAIFVGPGAACVLVWWLDGAGLFWPVWVLVYTGIPPVLSLVRARSRIAEREREILAAPPPPGELAA